MINNQTDVKLTENLKNNIETEASLKNLVERHSGIFLDIVNNYVPNNSPTCHKQDIIDEIEYYIYNAGLKYDQTQRGKIQHIFRQ